MRSILNVEKLKNRARKFEEKGNAQKALATYRQVIDGLEGTPELANELALFNKVGDLYLKVSQVQDAVEMYERAVSLYSDNGFPNNAIALCNKILRNAPGRTHVYLKLAQLMVERGFVAEAKQNLLEYAERMQKAGKTDEAFRALKEFADLSPDNEEIRLLLAEQLRAAQRDGEAREQLEKLYAEAQASGDERKSRSTLTSIKAIDPEFDEERASQTKIKAKKQKSSELVFLDIEYDTDSVPAPEEKAPPVEAAPAAVEPPAAPVAEPPSSELEIERVETEVEPEEVEVGAVEGLDVGQGFEVPTAADAGTGDALGLEPTSLADEAEAEVEPLELEPTSLAEEAADVSAGPADVEPMAAPTEEQIDIDAEPVAKSDDLAASLDLPEIEVETDDELVLEPARGESIEVPDLDFGAGLDETIDLPAEPEPAAAAPAVGEEDAGSLEALLEESAPEVAAPDVPALEAMVAEDPDNAAHHVALGEALIETGQRERGIEELSIALDMFEAAEEWNRAAAMANEILRLEPTAVAYHQKRVEFAYRIGDKSVLIKAYLDLADALFREGSLDRSRAVYQRVLEHDSENRRALDAIATLEPAAAEPEPAPVSAGAPPADGDFVDLGALVLDDEPVRDTRMRIEEEEPTGDEDRDFAEMLSQFKRGIEENIEEEDWQAHYDLGVAFKEMGLLDEAVAEFQKALRSPAGRLRTAEALGGCFFEKGQYSVAATVMRRAVESDSSGDEGKIGLLYWIARCEEEQQRVPEALTYYQRVFALDINFQDVSDRVKQLASAGK